MFLDTLPKADSLVVGTLIRAASQEPSVLTHLQIPKAGASWVVTVLDDSASPQCTEAATSRTLCVHYEHIGRVQWLRILLRVNSRSPSGFYGPLVA